MRIPFVTALVAVLLTVSASPATAQQFLAIELVPSPPATLDFGENVQVHFRYRTPAGRSVRVFARPLTGGQLTPYYAASGSPEFGPGSGSGRDWFTIEKGPVKVEGVRLQMVDADSGKVLLKRIVPAEYRFGGRVEKRRVAPGVAVPRATVSEKPARRTYGQLVLSEKLRQRLGEYRPPSWRLPQAEVDSAPSKDEIPACHRVGIEAVPCEQVAGRQITESGMVVIDCTDGSSWRTTDRGDVFTAPDGRSCRKVMMIALSGTAFPPAEPPAGVSAADWAAFVNGWLEHAVAATLLERIGDLVATEHFENYQALEERDTENLYQRIDYRLSFLEKLLGSP